MEEFLSNIKTDEGLTDEELILIKEVFTKEKIKFKQLMKTGELAITDMELKEYGIKQGGLRKAILTFIKSNSQ
jgi:hypothetical protein